MAILHGCLDESGKFRDSDYVSFCGYVSYAHDWEAFSQDWMSALLNERLGLQNGKNRTLTIVSSPRLIANASL